MNHLIVLPIVLPALVAALLLLGMRYRLRLSRFVSVASCFVLLALALALLSDASTGTIMRYEVGSWPAPFGIVLVLDRLSAMMLLITAILVLPVLCHAMLTGLDRKGWHFHALLQFQLLGLNGAFLTGDLFNLFVFFEVLLIASYGLMLHGQGSARLTAGVQYVIINLAGSTLFLVAVGILYGVTGTLNMADLARRVAAAPAEDQGLIRAGALLLTTVFALKAALLPLHLWLPRTYSSTSAPVAALFAIMTKVGVYSIIRTVTLIFGADAGAAAWAPAPWMLPAALATAVIGFLGLLAAHRLRELAAFALIGSTGTLLAATALFQPGPMAAAFYYLPHSTLAAAALFLVADLIARRRHGHGEALASGPRFAAIEPLSLLYLLCAIAIAGLPPLSGFVGKLLVLDAARSSAAWPWIWSVLLATTLVAILGFARAGSTLFWKSGSVDAAPLPAPAAVRSAELLPAMALVVLLAALTVFAGPVTRYMDAASAQVFSPAQYRAAVLAEG